jgi:transposase
MAIYNIDKQDLEYKYHTLWMTTPQIAETIGCNYQTILYWLNKYGIRKRTLSEVRKRWHRVGVPIFTEEEMRYKYVYLGKSAKDIAKEYKCTRTTVFKYIRDFNIPRLGAAIRLKGRNKYNDEGMRETSRKLTGRNKYNDASVKKMSETLSGRTKYTHEHLMKQSIELTGKNKYNDERYAKISAKNKGRTKENDPVVAERSRRMKGESGESCRNWKGGLSLLPYSPDFTKQLREQIRQRDGYTCQNCGRHRGVLESHLLDVHHIDYDKENTNQKNLITLCKGCHMRANNNREYWSFFYSSKMVMRGLSGTIYD